MDASEKRSEEGGVPSWGNMPSSHCRFLAGLRSSGNRLEGGAIVHGIKAQKVERSRGIVSLYVCLDGSKTKVVNREGADVTPSGRPDKRTLLVGFVPRGPGLVVSSSVAWSGSSVC